MQSLDVGGSFIFGPFLFSPERQSLFRGREQVRLGTKALDLLHLLVSRAGQVVSKDDLISHAWPKSTVDEANLKVHISSLRRVLGGAKQDTAYITTISGQGYRFTASVLMASAREAHEFYAAGGSQIGLPDEPDLVGRDRETEDVLAALGSAPVVTLFGPVGVGKASIARCAATSMLVDFPDGCCIVDFSQMSDEGAVPNFIALTLGLTLTSTDMTSALLDHLEHRRMLLIFDHCDRVVAAIRLFVARFIASSSPAKILAISLEPLRVPGENVYRVGLLGYPAARVRETLSKDAALSYPAVRMLVQRANELGGYELHEGDIPAIVGLCRVMDGRPRSINSALVNLLSHFSFTEMLDIVTRRVLFGPGPGEPDDPQCLMSGATDFGYHRLSAEEATLVRLLSVFTGSFELEDAVVMTVPAGWDTFRTHMALSNLVAKSLVWVEPACSAVKYRLLAAERFFARRRLAEHPDDLRMARLQHARVMLKVCEQAQAEWRWVEADKWRRRYNSRNQDLLDALEWCGADGGEPTLYVMLAGSAVRLWDEQSKLAARRPHLERALASISDLPGLDDIKCQLATAYAWSLTLSRDFGETTRRAWFDAIELAERSEDNTNKLSAKIGHCRYLFLTAQNIRLEEELSSFASLAADVGERNFVYDLDRFRSYLDADAGRVWSAKSRLRQISNFCKPMRIHPRSAITGPNATSPFTRTWKCSSSLRTTSGPKPRCKARRSFISTQGPMPTTL